MLRAAAVTAVVVAALALPALASAGTYTVSQCNQALTPTQGQAVPEATSLGYALSAGCGTGAGLQVDHNVLASTAFSTYGRWVWHAPTGTVFTSIEASAALVDGSNGDQARLVAVQPDGQALSFGAAGSAFEPADLLAGEFAEFRAQLSCVNPGSCSGGGGSQAAVRDVLLRTDDRAAPVATFSGGSLFSADAVRGSQTASVRVTDEGGGVRRLELRVNNALVYDSIRECQVSGGFATALQPCAGAADATTTVDASSAPFATGLNKVIVCGADLALEGLPNSDCDTRDVFVDNLCPGSAVGAGSKLSARFAGGKRTTRVRSDKPARVTGRLTTDSGDGIGGAKVCALTQVTLAGEPYRIADTAKTRGDGSYKLRLPPGASRNVFVDRAFGDQVLMRAGLETEASVRPSLAVAPNKKAEIRDGDRLRFRGHLPGPGCDGRIVKVQAKIGKRRWQVFRSVSTNAKCTYTTRYKLRSTSSSTRYLFRVRVPEQGDYPFLAGSSTVRAREAGPGRG